MAQWLPAEELLIDAYFARHGRPKTGKEWQEMKRRIRTARSAHALQTHSCWMSWARRERLNPRYITNPASVPPRPWPAGAPKDKDLDPAFAKLGMQTPAALKKSASRARYGVPPHVYDANFSLHNAPVFPSLDGDSESDGAIHPDSELSSLPNSDGDGGTPTPASRALSKAPARNGGGKAKGKVPVQPAKRPRMEPYLDMQAMLRPPRKVEKRV
ncbi:hypothetical protein JCM10213v2_006929 [Rhodosporidiobolus nylandii]